MRYQMQAHTLSTWNSLPLQILTCDKEFEHACLHLIIVDCLSTTNVENLNKTSKSFTHVHKILSHAEPNVVFKLFQHDTQHVSQTSIPIERRSQFFFLVVMNRLNAPSIMRSLTRNCTVYYRDPDTMLQECKDVLPPTFLSNSNDS